MKQISCFHKMSKVTVILPNLTAFKDFTFLTLVSV